MRFIVHLVLRCRYKSSHCSHPACLTPQSSSPPRLSEKTEVEVMARDRSGSSPSAKRRGMILLHKNDPHERFPGQVPYNQTSVKSHIICLVVHNPARAPFSFESALVVTTGVVRFPRDQD